MYEHTMSDEQAYPNGMTWEQRTMQRFDVGDAVRVGPAFVGYHHGVDRYTCDGFEGDYFVVGVGGELSVAIQGQPNYLLARVPAPESDWEVAIISTRLVRR